ncbi:MAG: triacylglycerol lipase [Butyrivibrio sp.]|nr:triacylglycerol lipase [Muribaculum sp.]MCM1552769.1 triacylglycerol lipase [Butyrivibrio sp.]
MRTFRRLYKTLFLLIIINITLVITFVNDLFAQLAQSGEGFSPAGILLKSSIYAVLFALFIVLEIFPCYEKGLKLRLQLLAGGYELILTSIYALIAELVFILLFLWPRMGLSRLFVINLAVGYCILLLHYLNGFWRTAFCSSQLGIGRRLVMLFFWWVFPINVFLFYGWCSIVRRELLTAKNKYLLDTARVQNAVCHTRYPVLMVHGIFFRDWQYLDYWGRIPKALKQNGANIYYGKQQSSLAVADSAQELKAELERVLELTGAEKVNIVAHSKGGLDARYVISKLGMAEHVASLTTINTPHRGCQFADALLGSLPKWLINFVSRRYNSLFHALGDDKPDFLAGVTDLTAAACARFNEEVRDVPGIYYQSTMSKMRGFHSTFLPLGFTYLLSKHYEGDNDGLVSVASASWGNYLGLVKADREGISHADMIDLTHKDIRGFDVSEFYVKLLADLKEKGF